tara:strand:- start:158 stop:832 length:675 start_codon:yes stop_codon:yes gene_type:complete
MRDDLIEELQKLICINFKNKNLLKESLVHKSFDSKKNNEKLEFLGDRVMGLVLSKILIESFPKEKEGIIDKKFANLVNKKTCTIIAKSLNLKKFMSIGDSHKGLSKSDNKILSDALEALIGAIYLDSGLSIAEKFILKHWNESLAKSDVTEIDAKTKLQEHSLKKFKELPKYKVFKESGPRHNPTFKVEVQIPNSKKYSATGKSKKDAQQNAAKKLLNDINIDL